MLMIHQLFHCLELLTVTHFDILFNKGIHYYYNDVYKISKNAEDNISVHTFQVRFDSCVWPTTVRMNDRNTFT